jgi:hypothetical protein
VPADLQPIHDAGAVVRVLAKDHDLDRVWRRQVQGMEYRVWKHRLARRAFFVDERAQRRPFGLAQAWREQGSPGGGQGIGLLLQADGLGCGAGSFRRVGRKQVGLHQMGW